MLSRYTTNDTVERDMLSQTLDFIQAHPTTCADRTLLSGHLTASAWVLDQSHLYVLLTKHRKLCRWLQLGGHADGDCDLKRVALREAQEESGLVSITPGSMLPFDIDVHTIPARNEVPTHLHYDVRFWFTADINEPLIVSQESTDLKWISLHDLESESLSDPSLRRMLHKSTDLK